MTDSIAATVRARLSAFAVPTDLVDELVRLLPTSLVGLILYGSWARGDARAVSDLDVLAVQDVAIHPSSAGGRVSLTSYSLGELRNITGTLYGYHLFRDGQILLDESGEVARILSTIEPPEPRSLLEKIRRLSVILTVNEVEMRENLTGLTQVARYLLRSALYTQALAQDQPCFSVGELAQRLGDPSLVPLLSSHSEEQIPPSRATLDELRSRLTLVVGYPALLAESSTLEGLAVESWHNDEDLSNLATLALSANDEGIPYEEVPKVVL